MAALHPPGAGEHEELRHVGFDLRLLGEDTTCAAPSSRSTCAPCLALLCQIDSVVIGTI